jgi:hypothetical protein
MPSATIAPGCRSEAAAFGSSKSPRQAAVLCLDLEDFFTSIPHARVFHVFRAAGYPGPVARVLAGVCTTELPPVELAQPAPGRYRGAR